MVACNVAQVEAFLSRDHFHSVRELSVLSLGLLCVDCVERLKPFDLQATSFFKFSDLNLEDLMALGGKGFRTSRLQDFKTSGLQGLRAVGLWNFRFSTFEL